MIKVYTERDLTIAIDTYIRNREINGQDRDTARAGAIAETVGLAALRKAVAEDTGLHLIADQSKIKTDKLPQH